jgi:hypothetical protein
MQDKLSTQYNEAVQQISHPLSCHSDDPDIRSEVPTGFSHKKRFNKIPLAHFLKLSKHE